MTKRKEQETSAVSTWDPFSDMDWFRSWAPFESRGPIVARLFDESRAGRLMPAADIAENEDEYTITVEVPGSSKEDLTVESKGNVLTIRGEKKNERDETKDDVHIVERRYGSFSRSFRLPADAAVDRMVANFKHGVLKIEVPKTEEEKPRVVKVGS